MVDEFVAASCDHRRPTHCIDFCILGAFNAFRPYALISQSENDYIDSATTAAIAALKDGITILMTRF